MTQYVAGVGGSISEFCQSGQKLLLKIKMGHN